MFLNSEVVNHFLRSDRGVRTFSSAVGLGALAGKLDADGNTPTRLSIGDGLACIVSAAMALHPDLVHPSQLVGIDMSADTVKNLILSLVRVQQPQSDLLDEPEHDARLLGKEVKDALSAHRVAQQILDRLAKAGEAVERGRKPVDLTMDEFVKLLGSSLNPELTSALILDAGPDHARWISPDGPLPPLSQPMLHVLPAKKPIEIDARVLYVRDKQGTAVIEIESARNEYSSAMLRHFASEVEVQFDNSRVERDDLVLMQYLKCIVPLQASAMCAVHSRFSKKTTLNLRKILVARGEMDQLHAKFRQLHLPIEDDC